MVRRGAGRSSARHKRTSLMSELLGCNPTGLDVLQGLRRAPPGRRRKASRRWRDVSRMWRENEAGAHKCARCGQDLTGGHSGKIAPDAEDTSVIANCSTCGESLGHRFALLQRMRLRGLHRTTTVWRIRAVVRLLQELQSARVALVPCVWKPFRSGSADSSSIFPPV